MLANQTTQRYTTTARLIGVLFLVSTIAYMLGTGLITSLLAAPNSLTHLTAQSSQLISGVLLQLVNSAAVVAIGVFFFPIVKRQSETTALAYVSTRILESAFLAIGGIATLVLLGISQGALAGTLDATAAAAMGTLLTESSATAYQVAMITLSLGSVPFCYLLYRSHIIPRPLAALGLLGYTTLLIGSVLELFGLDLQLLHNLPGGVFELILPIWLLVKGFNMSTIAAEARETERTTRERVGIAKA